MSVCIERDGLYVIFRYSDGTSDPIGFVIKPVSRMLFSERAGLWRGVKLGPIYARTYKRSAR